MSSFTGKPGSIRGLSCIERKDLSRPCDHWENSVGGDVGWLSGNPKGGRMAEKFAGEGLILGILHFNSSSCGNTESFGRLRGWKKPTGTLLLFKLCICSLCFSFFWLTRNFRMSMCLIRSSILKATRGCQEVALLFISCVIILNVVRCRMLTAMCIRSQTRSGEAELNNSLARTSKNTSSQPKVSWNKDDIGLPWSVTLPMTGTHRIPSTMISIWVLDCSSLFLFCAVGSGVCVLFEERVFSNDVSSSFLLFSVGALPFSWVLRSGTSRVGSGNLLTTPLSEP